MSSSIVHRARAAVVACALVPAALAAQFGGLRPRLPPPPPPPPPAPAPTPRPVTGYEIIEGPPIEVAPLQLSMPAAQCSPGRIPVGGGYVFGGVADNDWGYEVRGVSDFRTGTASMRARVRNANVFVRGTARASAVCIAPPPGVRKFEIGWHATDVIETAAACSNTEIVIGGGGFADFETQLNISAPGRAGMYGWTAGSGWRMAGQRSGAGYTHGLTGQVTCAPAGTIDGWEIVESASVSVGARGRARLDLRCPAGKVLLAAGVVGGSGIDMVVNRLVIAHGGTATAQVLNRNVLGGQVFASMTGICARAA